MISKSISTTLWLALLLSFCSTSTGRAESPKTITISASRFMFEPNEITVKKGEAVTLVIQSKDVTHGLVIKELGVRTEVKKGQSTEVQIHPGNCGLFRGQVRPLLRQGARFYDIDGSRRGMS